MPVAGARTSEPWPGHPVPGATLNDSPVIPKDFRLRLNDSRLPLNDSRLRLNDSRMRLNDSRLPLNDSRLALNDSRLRLNDSRLPLNDSRVRLNDSRVPLNSCRLGGALADAVGEFLKCPVFPLPPPPTPKTGAGEPELSRSLAQAWERDLGRGPSLVKKYFANSIRVSRTQQPQTRPRLGSTALHPTYRGDDAARQAANSSTSRSEPSCSTSISPEMSLGSSRSRVSLRLWFLRCKS